MASREAGTAGMKSRIHDLLLDRRLRSCRSVYGRVLATVTMFSQQGNVTHPPRTVGDVTDCSSGGVMLPCCENIDKLASTGKGLPKPCRSLQQLCNRLSRSKVREPRKPRVPWGPSRPQVPRGPRNHRTGRRRRVFHPGSGGHLSKPGGGDPRRGSPTPART